MNTHEIQRTPNFSYEEFTHAVRDLALLSVAVCKVFGVPVPRITWGDLQDCAKDNLKDSCAQILRGVPLDEFIARAKLELRDYIRGQTNVPEELRSAMDWEEFDGLIAATSERVWSELADANAEDASAKPQ